jgi:zinc-finger of acetyl-transferase ESCO
MSGEPTCQCGLSYVRGNTEDERLHALVHQEYLYGPTMPGLDRRSTLARLDELEVVRIDAATPAHLRSQAARVAGG